MTLSTERIWTLDENRACLAGNAASVLFPPDRDAASALMDAPRSSSATTSASSPDRPSSGSSGASATSSATSSTCACRRPPAATSTTSTSPGSTGRHAPPSRRPGPSRRAVSSEIGQRRKARPEGQSGFVRFDTVRGDGRSGEKGAYDIDEVDEVTQFQELAAVPRITEYFMVPVF